MELNFNKEKFAKILKNINETYNSQRDFAKESGINRTYLSQYMNLKLDEPPKPKILKRLAYFSNDIVSYEELMEVCGYIDNPTIEFSEKERTKIEVLTALKNLEIMGDCFAKRDTQIVRDYITDIEAENQKLKEKIADEQIR